MMVIQAINTNNNQKASKLFSLIPAQNAIAALFLYEQTEIMPKSQRRGSISERFSI